MDSTPQTTTTPRKKRALLVTLGAVALVAAAIGVASFRGSSDQISADVTNPNLALDSDTSITTEKTAVLVKVVNSGGQATPAFLDAIVDTNSNCTIDDGEEANGFSFETNEDGTAQLPLPSDQFYNLRAAAVDSIDEGLVTVAVGAVNATSCMKTVREANTEPIEIKLVAAQ